MEPRRLLRDREGRRRCGLRGVADARIRPLDQIDDAVVAVVDLGVVQLRLRERGRQTPLLGVRERGPEVEIGDNLVLARAEGWARRRIRDRRRPVTAIAADGGERRRARLSVAALLERHLERGQRRQVLRHAVRGGTSELRAEAAHDQDGVARTTAEARATRREASPVLDVLAVTVLEDRRRVLPDAGEHLGLLLLEHGEAVVRRRSAGRAGGRVGARSVRRRRAAGRWLRGRRGTEIRRVRGRGAAAREHPRGGAEGHDERRDRERRETAARARLSHAKDRCVHHQCQARATRTGLHPTQNPAGRRFFDAMIAVNRTGSV